MSSDTLLEVLRAVRLKGAVFFDVETSDPWVAEAPAASTIASAVMPDSEHVIEYHVVTSGSCWASVLGHPIDPVHFSAGDVVAFPQGDAHIMSSSPGMRGNSDEEFPDSAGQAAAAAQSRWGRPSADPFDMRLSGMRFPSLQSFAGGPAAHPACPGRQRGAQWLASGLHALLP